MKRNKTTARVGRSGASPYAKHKKRPCQHCQAITQDSRNRASRGEGRRMEAIEEARQ